MESVSRKRAVAFFSAFVFGVFALLTVANTLNSGSELATTGYALVATVALAISVVTGK